MKQYKVFYDEKEIAHIKADRCEVTSDDDLEFSTDGDFVAIFKRSSWDRFVTLESLVGN